MTSVLAEVHGLGLHSGAEATLVATSRGEGIALASSAGRFILGPDAARQATGHLSTGLPEVHTIEHWLAALVGMGWGGVELELVRGSELPTLGGDAVGVVELLAPHQARMSTLARFAPPVTLFVAQGESWARWSPGRSDTLEVCYNIDFRARSSVIGVQRFVGALEVEDFAVEIARARTFAVVSDMEQLMTLRDEERVGGGLAPGDALVAGPDGWLHGEPRWPDEPVRHKVLDLLGDLGLLGVRPAGLIEVHLGGHRLHRALGRLASAYL